MRTQGKLVRWNDERGFGFVETAAGAHEVFVHISAFPRDGIRPRIGELLSFDVQSGDEQRQRAVQVQRPAHNASGPAKRHRTRPPRKSWRTLGALAFLIVVALVGYRLLKPQSADYVKSSSAEIDRAKPRTPTEIVPDLPQPFQCDGRTMCSQMHSCAEATLFIKRCAGTKMDGGGDGVPCESQWCE